MPGRICITGASGYLGRALCQQLAAGAELLTLVRNGGAARVAAGVPAVEFDVFDVAQLAAVLAAGLTATILRHWYVLGPGHRWPYLLLPFYAAAQLVPGIGATARRLGMVSLAQMSRALANAVDNAPPTHTTRVLEVAEIRAA